MKPAPGVKIIYSRNCCYREGVIIVINMMVKQRDRISVKA